MKKRNLLLLIVIAVSIICTSCASTGRGKVSVVSSDVLNEIVKNRKERIARAQKNFGEYYATKVTIFINELPDQETGGVLFIGDSITEGSPFKKALSWENVVVHGIGGDKIAGIADRLDISLEALKPSRIYIMVGINNIAYSKAELIDSLAQDYVNLMDDIKRLSPQAEVIVQSVLPVRGHFAPKMSWVHQYNAITKAAAEERGFKYVDLHPAVSDENGLLKDAYTPDGVHLTLGGYIAWLEVILSNDEFFEAMKNLASYKVAYPLKATDPPAKGQYGGSRGENEMLIYTPAYSEPKTCTNEWGYEVIVRNGKVTSMGGNNLPIPADGYVLSGHGKANKWLRDNLAIGSKIIVKDNQVSCEQPDIKTLPANEQLLFVRSNLFLALAEMKEANAPKGAFEKAKQVLTEIQELKKSGKEISEADIKCLDAKVKKLRAEH